MRLRMSASILAFALVGSHGAIASSPAPAVSLDQAQSAGGSVNAPESGSTGSITLSGDPGSTLHVEIYDVPNHEFLKFDVTIPRGKTSAKLDVEFPVGEAWAVVAVLTLPDQSKASGGGVLEPGQSLPIGNASPKP